MTMLSAVLKSGADAVYFGIDHYNMRVKARNFSVNDLPEIVDLCRAYEAEAHLALNTILFDNELDEAKEIVQSAKSSGIDMIICWDFAVMQMCREVGIPFCISTQASVSNSIAASVMASFGAKRIVLARECSLQDIRAIREKTNIEIELFAHGAMCIAVSGRCFMSQEIFGHSANRGDCLQNCRREYEIYDGRKDESMMLGKDYVLSSKDLMTVDILEHLIETGADSLKIEGRKRSPEYAAKVTAIYRRAIDAYYEGMLTPELKEELKGELGKIYNRGFITGFYTGIPDGNSFSGLEGNAATERKTYIGKVLNYYPKAGAVYVLLETGEITMNDKIIIIGQTSGVVELTLSRLMEDEKIIAVAVKGQKITFPCSEKVRPGDKVYKIIVQNNNQKIVTEMVSQ